jgi:hypothetical protein
MSAHYPAIYRKQTGEIVETGFFACDDELVEMNFAVKLDMHGGSDHDYIDQQAEPGTQYVVVLDGEPVLADRPVLRVMIDKSAIAADGEDMATLTGLPNPCTIIVDDDDPLTPTSIVEVEGGGFTFSTEDPGPYSFEVRGRFPFLPWKTVVTAT